MKETRIVINDLFKSSKILRRSLLKVIDIMTARIGEKEKELEIVSRRDGVKEKKGDRIQWIKL